MAETAYRTNGFAKPKIEEIGTSGLRVSGGRVDEEFELAWRQSRKHRTIREMIVDPMISRSMWTFELLIRNVEWSFEPAGKDNESMRAAEFANSVLFEDQSHSWDESLSNHMSMLPWGWAYHELVWKRRQGQKSRQEPGLNSQYTDGRWGLRKTAFRGQNTLWEWQLDTQNSIQAMVQMDSYATPARGSVVLPIEHCLLFRLSSYRDSPEGKSLLRAAYIPWYRKKNIATLQGIGIERDLAGLPFMRVPGELMTSTDPEVVAARQHYENVGRNIRRDEQAYIMLPSNRDVHGEYIYDFSLLSSEGNTAKIDTQPIIDNYNKEMLIALMTDVVLIGHEQVGSLALHSSATQLLSYGLGGMMDSICEVYNRHFMPRLWANNGLPMETMPTLIHGDVETVDLDELGNFVVRMAQGGFDITDLENEIRRRAGFPLKEMDDAGMEQRREREEEPPKDEDENPDELA